MAWAYLLWVASTLTVDYYDGFEYLMTGVGLNGHTLFSHLKSPLLTVLFALVQLPIRGMPPSLAPFHLAMALVNLSGIVIIAKWIRRYCPSLSLIEIAAVVTFNRLVVHYLPFAITDLPAAGLIGLWLWVEAELPLSSRKGMLGRAAVLGLCVLGRAPIAVIPVVSVTVEAWRSRRLGAFLAIGSASLVAILAAGGILNALAGKSFIAGSVGLISPAWNFFSKHPLGIPPAPSYLFIFFFLLLTPAGVLLAALGAAKAVRRASGLPSLSTLIGPALGALCWFAYLMFGWASWDARYLSPLLAFWALIQCRGVAWLSRKKAWAGTLAIVVLFLSVVPEFLHSAQSFYRADSERRAAAEIAQWSRSKEVVFVGALSAAMAPEKHVFHPGDCCFYVYHWSLAAYSFFTRQQAYYGNATFSRYGYPIPDQMPEIVQPGVTVIVASDSVYVTETMPPRLPPIYALRWYPKEAGNSDCSPAVPDLCVQILTVNPREGEPPESVIPPKEWIEPDEALMKRGLAALYEQNDPVRAEGLFREMLKRNPAHYGATFQLAVALDNSGRRPAARTVWKQALTMAESYNDPETAKRIRVRLQSDP